MSTTVTDSLAVSSDLGPATWFPEAAPTPKEPVLAPRRAPRAIAAISDLIHSYHRPAYMADERGEVICMNAAAGRLLDGGENNIDLKTSASVQIGERTFQLFVPPPELADNEEEVTETHLPPRLARIARLVVSGCTDKQIATRTGLSFSTVRTYVRQIYRRVGVHNRVELVHRTNAGAILL